MPLLAEAGFYLSAATGALLGWIVFSFPLLHPFSIFQFKWNHIMCDRLFVINELLDFFKWQLGIFMVYVWTHGEQN